MSETTEQSPIDELELERQLVLDTDRRAFPGVFIFPVLWALITWSSGLRTQWSDTFVAPYKELDASVAWRFNSHLQLSLDALNLLDSTYYSYFGTPDMLSGKYKNGTQYMLTLHMKL